MPLSNPAWKCARKATPRIRQFKSLPFLIEWSLFIFGRKNVWIMSNEYKVLSMLLSERNIHICGIKRCTRSNFLSNFVRIVNFSIKFPCWSYVFTSKPNIVFYLTASNIKIMIVPRKFMENSSLQFIHCSTIFNTSVWMCRYSTAYYR